MHEPETGVPTTEVALKTSLRVSGRTHLPLEIVRERIELSSGDLETFTTTLSLSALKTVELGRFCKIAGHITAGEKVSTGANCVVAGDIVSKKVDVGSRSIVLGNIIAEGQVRIEEGAWIGGHVISAQSSVRLFDNVRVLDASARGDVVLGAGAWLVDPVAFSSTGIVEAEGAYFGPAMDGPFSTKAGERQRTLSLYASVPDAVAVDELLRTFEDALSCIDAPPSAASGCAACRRIRVRDTCPGESPAHMELHPAVLAEALRHTESHA